MTMLIAANLGDYVIIAADKRTVMIDAHGMSKVISNNEVKIIKCDIGAVTGCGYVDILDRFKLLIKENVINSTDTIINIAERVLSKSSFYDYEKLLKTNYLFCYLTELDNKPSPRIGIIKASEPSQVRIVDNVCILCGENEDLIYGMQNFLIENLIKTNGCDNNELPIEHINTNLTIISDIYKKVSTQNNSVSSNVDFFIFHNDTQQILYDYK